MVTINLVPIIVLFAVGWFIWKVLPEDMTEEIGMIMGWLVEFIWFVAWFILFPVMGLTISFSFQ